MLKKVLIGAYCVFAALNQTASEAAYNVQELPPLFPRGGEATRSSYIGWGSLLNDSGQIAGQAYQGDGASDPTPAIWSNGTLTDLGVGRSGYALGVSNDGQVLIQTAITLGAPESGGCVVWSNGVLTNIGNPSPWEFDGCWSGGMNAAGQVIATYDVVNSSNIYRGRSVFLWTKGTKINLDPYDNENWRNRDYICYGLTSYVYDMCPNSVNDVAIDINDAGQVLFLQRHFYTGLNLPVDPVPDGPVVWSNGIKIAMPKPANIGTADVGFGVGKSINNRGDVLGYTGATSFVIWNVNTGTSYQFDTGYDSGAGTVSAGLPNTGWAKLNNQGEVYFPRADGIYKLTPEYEVKQVMSYICPGVNKIAAVNDLGQVVACGYINYHGVATLLSSLVPANVSLSDVFGINNAGQIWTLHALLSPIPQNTASCDADHDGKINTTDLSIIYAANNTRNPAYDVDGDGKITVRDMRICVLQCNNANCQP